MTLLDANTEIASFQSALIILNLLLTLYQLLQVVSLSFSLSSWSKTNEKALFPQFSE